MNDRKLIYLPLALPFFFILLFLVIFFPFIMSGAFRVLGFDPRIAITLFFLSLLGSMINIPLHTVYTHGEVTTTRLKSFFGLIYPEVRREYRVRKTTIAINLGGALIPIFISIYLVFTHPELWWEFLVGIGVVSAICYKLARLVPGVGITMPGLIPPLIAALIALLLPGDPATATAYVSGVIGVLLGADLLHLNKASKSGARVLSIGGAGTFDGIFLTGIISVILAA
jgi:uncharacterized membrane protein